MWNDVALLELEAANATFDLQFWKSLINEYRPKRVLELACGTGRITLPLAAEGLAMREDFEIVGIDLSKSFVDHARLKAVALSSQVAKSVQFTVGDMRSFEFERPFDLVVIPFNSFGLLLELDDQLSCLRSVKKSLGPEGMLAVDIVAPGPFYETLVAAGKPLPPVRVMNEWEGASEGVDWFSQRCFERYDSVRQVVRRVIYSEAHYQSGEIKVFRQIVRYRAIFPQELEALLRLAELIPVKKYGNYDRSEFNGSSWQYLWTITHH